MRNNHAAMDIAKNTSAFMKEVYLMSAIKRWLEDHISELTDEELLNYGYPKDIIDELREAFTEKEP